MSNNQQSTIAPVFTPKRLYRSNQQSTINIPIENTCPPLPRGVVKMTCFGNFWSFTTPRGELKNNDFLCVVLPAWRKVSTEMTDPPDQICVFECNLKFNNYTNKQKLFGGSAFYSPVHNNSILYKNIYLKF